MNTVPASSLQPTSASSQTRLPSGNMVVQQQTTSPATPQAVDCLELNAVAKTRQQISQHFDKAAQSYKAAARLQTDVALDLLSIWPTQSAGTLLDLGAGPGWLHVNLSARCDKLWALDLSPAMLEQCQQEGIADKVILADAAQVPLPDASVDQIFSSLMLQWSSAPQQVLAEIYRLLKPGGSFAISTLVEGSLSEFADSWQLAGRSAPQLQFLATAELLALVKASGLQVKARQKNYSLFFSDVFALAREFKQIGANYTGVRSSGLTGKATWQQFAKAYEPKRTTLGLPLSYQVLLLVGQKPLAPESD